jgi:hypothetical protein
VRIRPGKGVHLMKNVLNSTAIEDIIGQHTSGEEGRASGEVPTRASYRNSGFIHEDGLRKEMLTHLLYGRRVGATKRVMSGEGENEGGFSVATEDLCVSQAMNPIHCLLRCHRRTSHATSIPTNTKSFRQWPPNPLCRMCHGYYERHLDNR